MGFRVGERVYTGNSIDSAPSIGTYNVRDDGTKEFINIIGTLFQTGDLVFGEDSGYSVVLSESNLNNRVLGGTPWNTDDWIVQDDGSVIVLDVFFDGTTSQNYQQELVITL